MLATTITLLNKIPAVDKGFEKLEEASSQPRKTILGGFVSLISLLVFFISGARSFSYMVGFVYPTFRSYQAIQSPEADDDKKWLVYWVVYAMITTLENALFFIVYWIPFFQAIKTIAFVFLWHEQFEGAEKLLNFLVKKAKMDEGASTRKDE